MQLNVTTLVYWKKDHNAETNEDALDLDIERGLYVVCDGVGEASFSNEWAPVLARSFIERPLFSEDPFELEHWTRAAQTDARPRMTDPETLTGVARDKARRGAAATLCGMVLMPRREHDGVHYGYNLTAVGDSNFFHWRPDPSKGGAYKLLVAFPLKKYADFNSSPDSLNSRSHNRDNVAAHTFSSTPDLDLREGDVLFLATDAVSQWIFREYEATLAGEDTRRHPAPPILEIAAQHDAQPGIEVIGSPWANLIDRLREGNDIVDDDSIMIILRVLSTSRGGDIRSTDPEPRVKERSKELLGAVSRWLSGGVGSNRSDVDIAVAFGDGGYIDPAIRARLAASARFRATGPDAGSFRASHIELWRANADTYKRVTDGVRAVVRDDADPRQREESKRLLEETWQEVREQLIGLTWMKGLITTLQGMGIEQAESAGASAADESGAKDVREGTERVYRAIGEWVTGRGSEAAIVKAFDSNHHLDPAFAAAIATPIGVQGGMVSHIDIWRARATGGDAPTPVPPRKKAKARPAMSDVPEDTAPKVPLPPKPGITSGPPLPPPGEAPKPAAPRQPPPPPSPPTTSPGGSRSPEPSPPTPPRQSYNASTNASTQSAAVGRMAAPIPQPYPPQASSRTLLWAVGGAALLGSIILVVALVWILSSQQPAPGPTTPVPGTATVTRTPGTPSTATATATATTIAVTPNRTSTAVSVIGGSSTAIPTSTQARATDTPSATSTPASGSEPITVIPTFAPPTWTAGTAPRPAQPAATVAPTPATSYLWELTLSGWLPASKSIYFVLQLSSP